MHLPLGWQTCCRKGSGLNLRGTVEPGLCCRRWSICWRDRQGGARCLLSLTGDELLDRWKRAEMGPHPRRLRSWQGGVKSSQPGGIMSPVLRAPRVVVGRAGEAGSRGRPASHFGVWSVLQTEEAVRGWGGGDSQWPSERLCFPKGTVPAWCCCHGLRGTCWPLTVG